MNENYAMPAMPEGAEAGILRGIYRLLPRRTRRSAPAKAARRTAKRPAGPRVHLLGSGAILNETVKAQALLAEKCGVAADVWSVTSYKELYRDAIATERWNLLHPGEAPRVPYLAEALAGTEGDLFVAASDYLRVLPLTVARWLPGPLTALGTDGFGRSDGRAQLRDFFEVDARYIALAALRRPGPRRVARRLPSPPAR